MELQEVLNSRRSMRSYDAEKKVTKEQLETIINAAILAPSWKNLQTSRYYCILSDDKIEEFRHKCLPENEQAVSVIAVGYGTKDAQMPKRKSVSDIAKFY